MTGRIDQRNILLAIAAAALILCAAAINFMEPPAAEAPADTRPPAQATAPAGQETDAQDKPSASDLWSDDGSLHRIKPLDVDLDAETQWAIYEACGYDPGLFSLVMAIAEHESEFQPDLHGLQSGDHDSIPGIPGGIGKVGYHESVLSRCGGVVAYAADL